ncbi:MAG: redoxin domain-containing protein [Flavobacteriales bacterium]|nr:redoxin domain-containing protein [Flavobacteriales bacterium]
MRLFLALALLISVPALGQSGEWDPAPYNAAGIRFHDDLDFFLTSYTKPEIRAMRKEVSTWRMNFDKMMKATVADIRTYSEGGNMAPRTHPFTLPVVGRAGTKTLTDTKGKVRVLMFGSITNPPARAQLPLWEKLQAKYDTAQVELFVVYGHELHPGDKKKFRRYPVPRIGAEKAAYAQEFAAMTTLPVLLDGMDDKVFNAYGKAPNGAYVIDADGRLVFRATWADSRKIEEIVDRLLQWYAAGRPKL